jgi:hypothetical protein
LDKTGESIRIISYLLLTGPILFASYEVASSSIKVAVLIHLIIIMTATGLFLKIINYRNPLRGSNIMRNLLRSLGYPDQDIDEKLNILSEFLTLTTLLLIAFGFWVIVYYLR